jgi:hypothetical protein
LLLLYTDLFIKNNGHFYPWGHRKGVLFGLLERPVYTISRSGLASYNEQHITKETIAKAA